MSAQLPECKFLHPTAEVMDSDDDKPIAAKISGKYAEESSDDDKPLVQRIQRQASIGKHDKFPYYHKLFSIPPRNQKELK